jgi:tetratricopeptide (TPR) repeat protein
MAPKLPILVLVAVLAAAGGGCDDQPAAVQREAPTAGEPAVSAAQPAKPVSLSPELAAAARLISDRKTDQARSWLDAHLASHPDDGQAAFLLGLTYHREKRYTLARPWFESAVRLAPQYHTIHHFHGWCLYYLGDMPGARVAFIRHIEAVPGEGDSHFALGLIAFDDDRLDDAQRRFAGAIELQRDNPGRRRDVSKAHARLADVHIRRDELEGAKTQLLLATELWPQHYAAFYKLSRVLTRLGEDEAADQAFRQFRVWEQRAAQRRGVPEQVP